MDTGCPADLTLIFVAGSGDGKSRGLNHFGHRGMVRRVIGGHWGLVPTLGRLAADNEIEAYCLPMGLISHWLRDVAGGRPGTLSRVGLGTFVDPRLEGGRMNERSTEDVVELVELRGEEYLFAPRRQLDVALLRGTTADAEGNITMEREAVTLEALSTAQAVHSCGGLVIVQVERTTTVRVLSPRDVQIPGVLVDAVVVSPPENHRQTFSEVYNPAYTGEVRVPSTALAAMELNSRKIIARRAAMSLKPNAVVNLGIGIPEGVASIANEEGILDLITLTVEAGGVGGIPAGGLSFGATANPQAILDQPYQFDFYDGGGLDQAFLGMAEADEQGNVNVSKFGTRIAGPGGFINISQAVKEVYFLGLFRAGATLAIEDGRLRVVTEGPHRKFEQTVGQITFSGRRALERRQTVYFITERCVLRLTRYGLEIVEIAPGLDLDRDVISQMGFKPAVSGTLTTMNAAIFQPEPMGLQHRYPTPAEQRLAYDAAENILYCNFEGLTLETPDQAATLANHLDKEFQRIGHRVHVLVNYDNFNLLPPAQSRFITMIEQNEQYVLSRTSYSTNAFFRRRLGMQLTAARPKQRLYSSLADAHDGLNLTDTNSAGTVAG
jgi:propionate CoA-transferase